MDWLLFVIRLGFEPKTHSLEGCCSIQLSYQTSYIAGAKVRIKTELSSLLFHFFLRARLPYLKNVALKLHVVGLHDGHIGFVIIRHLHKTIAF